MIEEDFFTQKQNYSTNGQTSKEEEEEIIKSVFAPSFKKKDSWNSQNSNDIYFYKSSSKFPENFQHENSFNKKESFGLMVEFDNFDNAYDNLFFSENNLSDEHNDNIINEKQEEFPHFLNEGLNNSLIKCINDNDTINILIPINEKGKEGIEEEKLISFEKPIEKKLKRGKRGPYKKKPKLIIETKTEDECFPFTKGKGIFPFENDDNKLNKFKTETNGDKRREKKARKYKPDDIRKKIKVRFHKKIKNIINENLKKAGSNKLFSFLPQFFIGNISKKFNNRYMNVTFEELLSINFCEFQKEYFNKECDFKQYLKNKEVLKYLEENPEISKISGFNKLKKMKYRDILLHYFSSLEFGQSINQLEKENEDAEYIKEYIYLSKSYIEYFTSSDDSM